MPRMTFDRAQVRHVKHCRQGFADQIIHRVTFFDMEVDCAHKPGSIIHIVLVK